jgi:hypothetical protein
MGQKKYMRSNSYAISKISGLRAAESVDAQKRRTELITTAFRVLLEMVHTSLQSDLPFWRGEVKPNSLRIFHWT